jgi:hypothetical protein
MFELPNIKEHENPFGISGDVLCVQRDRRTDEANLIDVLQGSNTPTAIFRPTQFIKNRRKIQTYIQYGKSTDFLLLELEIKCNYFICCTLPPAGLPNIPNRR